MSTAEDWCKPINRAELVAVLQEQIKGRPLIEISRMCVELARALDRLIGGDSGAKADAERTLERWRQWSAT